MADLNNVSDAIPFTYLVTAPGVVTAGSVTQNLTFMADSRFELSAILGYSSQQDPTDYMPNEFTCLITDQTTGRQLSSAPLPQILLGGNAFQSLLQRRPMVFEPQSILSFQLTNLNASTATLYIALQGTKLMLR